jgi:hypothetical protein
MNLEIPKDGIVRDHTTQYLKLANWINTKEAVIQGFKCTNFND